MLEGKKLGLNGRGKNSETIVNVKQLKLRLGSLFKLLNSALSNFNKLMEKTEIGKDLRRKWNISSLFHKLFPFLKFHP